MAGLSGSEKWILALTAAFLLLTGGFFLARQELQQPYEVTVGTEQVQQEEETRPDSLLEGEVIDLNTADVYDLQRLPGIGEVRARAIVAYREEHGPFQSLEELEQVKGIGPATIAGLEGCAGVGPEI